MIKNFSDISDDEIKYLISHPIALSEKLDVTYFKIEVTSIIAIPLKTPKFNAVSDIDCIINSMYKNISDFSYSTIYKIRNELVNKYGNIRLGFFYLPVGKTKHIDYSSSVIFNNHKNYKNGWVGLSDVYFYDKEIREKYTVLDVYNDIINLGINIDKPCIIYENYNLIDVTEESIKSSLNDPIAISTLLFPDTPTFSGLPVNEIEGYIIKCGNKQWQIKINNAEPNINKNTKKIYRDTILNSLVHDLLDKTNIINDIRNMKSSYEDKVSYVFEEFMNHTDIFSKISIDPEDLLPPIDGYIGEMCIDSLSSNNVKTICKYSETAKNILRLFLHTFTNTIFANKFSDLSEYDRLKMNDLIIALKYRNYADIALSIAKK